MKVMIRRGSNGVLSAYVPKKDLEEPIVSQEKETLWDETKRLFNPHKVYVDLSRKLYDTKAELLNRVNG